MKNATLIIAFALLFNLGYAQQQDDAGLAARFDKMMLEQFKAGGTGATVLVARKGDIIYKKAFGMANLELDVPMQVDNVFRIASLTKQFTAIAILQLMEQGKLNLEDEIGKVIPGYPTQGAKITIEHLLTHTSGITDYTSLRDTVKKEALDYTPSQMIDRFKNLPLRFAPGTRWEYSNSGYFLLGYIIERLTGKTYAEYLEENIFKRLQMTSSLFASDIKLIKKRAAGYTEGETGYQNPPYLSMTQPYAAGAILSTVEDLFKWHQAVIANKLVKQESLNKAFARYKLTDGKETAYGYGWRIGSVYESLSIWHGGLINGFKSMAVYLPREDVYVALLSNCDCSSPEVVTPKLAALAAGRPYEYKALASANNNLLEYTGVYENGKGQQRIITVSDNQLFSQLGRGPRSSIRAFQKDQFFFDADAMSTIAFTRNKTGGIEKLTTENIRGNEVWNKSGKPLPNEDGIKLADRVLETILGMYEVSPDFAFSITKEQSRLYLLATGQEKVELFAETPSLFFLKVNDAQLQFVKDATGKVTKAILKQGGRETDAKKIK
ncbi:MAG TPA: serine hydrolase [Flavisolibacter sp.]|nr:serine hydrolase [Flavisolibacter sp.]